jgi:hypothetical protein
VSYAPESQNRFIDQKNSSSWQMIRCQETICSDNFFAVVLMDFLTDFLTYFYGQTHHAKGKIYMSEAYPGTYHLPAPDAVNANQYLVKMR